MVVYHYWHCLRWERRLYRTNVAEKFDRWPSRWRMIMNWPIIKSLKTWSLLDWVDFKEVKRVGVYRVTRDKHNFYCQKYNFPVYYLSELDYLFVEVWNIIRYEKTFLKKAIIKNIIWTSYALSNNNNPITLLFLTYEAILTFFDIYVTGIRYLDFTRCSLRLLHSNGRHV